jgi:hypothetical protein
MKTRALVMATVAAAVLAGPVLACGDEPTAVNLIATPGVKTALRSTYLRAHPELAAARIGRPVAGRTYYGAHMGTLYAVATFAVGSRPAHPTIFQADRHGEWHLRRQTHGGICTDVVPLELIRAWWLEHRGGRCFVEPSGR